MKNIVFLQRFHKPTVEVSHQKGPLFRWRRLEFDFIFTVCFLVKVIVFSIRSFAISCRHVRFVSWWWCLYNVIIPRTGETVRHPQEHWSKVEAWKCRTDKADEHPEASHLQVWEGWVQWEGLWTATSQWPREWWRPVRQWWWWHSKIHHSAC